MTGIMMAVIGSSGLFFVTGGSTSVSGSATRPGAGSLQVTTTSATVGTITGGTSPYSYLWQYVSGDTFSVISSTSGSTTFSTTITIETNGSVTKTGIYRCQVTDGVGRVIYGPNCTVSATLSDSA
jgi:hypothetical protein